MRLAVEEAFESMPLLIALVLAACVLRFARKRSNLASSRCRSFCEDIKEFSWVVTVASLTLSSAKAFLISAVDFAEKTLCSLSLWFVVFDACSVKLPFMMPVIGVLWEDYS